MRILTIIAVLAGILAAAPLFVQEPVITVNPSGGYWIEFQLSEAIDIDVSVVDTATDKVVRHVAAGLLGANAPAPLAKDSLHQKLAWDGTDDLLRPVTLTAVRARVRGGLSLALDTIVGENNYAFYRAMGGVIADTNGGFFAFGAFPWLGHHGTSNMALRKYDATGNYVRTLWPIPAGLPSNVLSLHRVLTLPDNSYLPKTEAMDAPQFGNTPMTYENSFLMSGLLRGKLMVFEYPTLRYVRLNPDGGADSTAFLVKSPALTGASAAGKMSGPMYVTPSPDGSYFLLSGIYYADSTGGSCFPTTTGFWREGQVFKVTPAGAATPFISVAAGTLPTSATRKSAIGPTQGDWGYMAVFHGTAFDASGRIYVCDRLNDEVGVYDAAGTRLGGLPATDPDQVAVNDKTGAVYVLCRQFSYSFNNYYPPAVGSGTLTLWKFANWSAATGAQVTLRKAAVAAKGAAVMDMTKMAAVTMDRLNMTIDNSGDKAVIWLNGPGGPNYCSDTTLANIKGYRDDGDSLALIKDFRNETRRACTGFDRIAVDPVAEKVYVNNSWDQIYKVEDWSNPVLSRCSTSTGPLVATDMTVSPDGFLYTHEGIYNGPLKRYTQDHRHAPANFGGRGTNVVVDNVPFGFGGGTQDHGLAVSRDGRIYTYNGGYLNTKLQKYDTTGALLKDNVVGLNIPAGGIAVDWDNMIYISAAYRDSVLLPIPSAFSTYWPWRWSTGMVIKFNPDTAGAFGNTGSDIEPAKRLVSRARVKYPVPVSPFGGPFHTAVAVPSARWGCVCRTPRFSVDGFGRVWAPHTVAASAAVCDNAGNVILSFGQYGNVDNDGPGIPLSWPAGVAASDNYVYVTDLVNARLLRLKMNFYMDNIVKSDRSTSRGIPGTASLKSVPEPFNPVSRITVGLPVTGDMRLEVVDLTGKIVRVIFNGNKRAGTHDFLWNAVNQGGKPVASGTYVYRLTAGKARLALRTVYMR